MSQDLSIKNRTKNHFICREYSRSSSGNMVYLYVETYACLRGFWNKIDIKMQRDFLLFCMRQIQKYLQGLIWTFMTDIVIILEWTVSHASLNLAYQFYNAHQTSPKQWIWLNSDKFYRELLLLSLMLPASWLQLCALLWSVLSHGINRFMHDLLQ